MNHRTRARRRPARGRADRHPRPPDSWPAAEPDTLRYRLWHLPARLARHARQRVLKPSRTWPWGEAS